MQAGKCYMSATEEVVSMRYMLSEKVCPTEYPKAVPECSPAGPSGI